MTISIFKKPSHALVESVVGDLGKVTNLVAEINRTRIDLDRIQKEIAVKEPELKKILEELKKIDVELLQKNEEIKTCEKTIQNRQEILMTLDKQIPVKKEELEKVKNTIEVQIVEGKIKEEKELYGLRELKKKIKTDLDGLKRELTEKGKASSKLSAANFDLQKEVNEKKQEYKELQVRIDNERKAIKQEHQELDSRMALAGEREKLLNLYNDRIQRWAKNLNVQLREI